MNTTAANMTSAPISAAASSVRTPQSKLFGARLGLALEHLALAVPQIKKNVLNACAEIVAADGILPGREAELVRAITDSLDCPLRP
jgi:hypothetical protein